MLGAQIWTEGQEDGIGGGPLKSMGDWRGAIRAETGARVAAKGGRAIGRGPPAGRHARMEKPRAAAAAMQDAGAT